MTKEEAIQFIEQYKVHGCRDYRDAAMLGQAIALTMSEESKLECAKIIQKHLYGN